MMVLYWWFTLCGGLLLLFHNQVYSLLKKRVDKNQVKILGPFSSPQQNILLAGLIIFLVGIWGVLSQ